MYRTALAGAAEGRGWTIHWYDRKLVFAAASEALQVENLDAHFRQVRKSVGPPWGIDQKLAMAAAIVAAQAPQHALRGAGFVSPGVLLSIDSLRLYACEKKAG
jgi:hypothetical protein